MRKNKNNTRPPRGLKPRWLHEQNRQYEILEAMYRYLEVNKRIPKKWVLELKLYCEK